MPLPVVMFNRIGVLKHQRLTKWRRGIIVGLFAFAAAVPPGQDPISMCALAGTLTVQISRAHDRRTAERKAHERANVAGADHLDDLT